MQPLFIHDLARSGRVRVHHVVLGHYGPARHWHVSTGTSVVVAKFKFIFWNPCAIHETVLIVIGIRHDQIAGKAALEIRLPALKFKVNEGSDALLGGVKQRLFTCRIWEVEDGCVGGGSQSTRWTTNRISWSHRISSNPNRPAEPGRTILPIFARRVTSYTNKRF
jgi:hypothetical protein